MKTLKAGTITGPEARGGASLIADEDGAITVELTDLWIAPGAPDVRLYVSQHADPDLVDLAVDLGPLPDGKSQFSVPLPESLDPNAVQLLIVYCKVYSVHFGSARFAATQ